MMQRRNYLEYYWNPYMLYEREFLALLDCVALRERNLGTCSESIIQQLLTVCTCIESILKSMYEPEKEKPCFPDFAKALLADELFSPSMPIRLKQGQGIETLRPFDGLVPDKAPSWWSAHNRLKHDRISNFEQGSFENLLNSLAALYYLEMVYAKKIGDHWHDELDDFSDENCRDVPNDVSRLFELEPWETRHQVSGFEMYIMTEEALDAIFKT